MKRRFKFGPKLLGGIGLALVVLVVVGFFAIRAIEGSSPPPLTAPVATVNATGSPAAAATASAAPMPTVAAATAAPEAAPAPVPAAAPTPTPSPPPKPSYDGTWSAGRGSVAGYRVRETLFGASNIAVGRTNTITGSLTVAAGKLTAGNFSVDVASVRS